MVSFFGDDYFHATNRSKCVKKYSITFLITSSIDDSNANPLMNFVIYLNVILIAVIFCSHLTKLQLSYVYWVSVSL